MRGRKPKPTHLRLITGNPGKRPLNPAEPKPTPAMPTVPPHLSDEAKVEWGRIANELHENGLLTRLDRAILGAYCQACADLAEAELELRKTGPVITVPAKTKTRTSTNGTTITETIGERQIRSPWLAVRDAARDAMKSCAVEFGMSPSARSRVSATDGKEKEDPGKEFF